MRVFPFLFTLGKFRIYWSEVVGDFVVKIVFVRVSPTTPENFLKGIICFLDAFMTLQSDVGFVNESFS